MPVNEFEKQVQKLMDELKVAPSENVWPKVEERIRERKRRRKLIIFPLLIGLVLFGYLATSYLFSKNKTGMLKENLQKEKELVPSESNVKTGKVEERNRINQIVNKKVQSNVLITNAAEVQATNEKLNNIKHPFTAEKQNEFNLNEEKKDLVTVIITDIKKKTTGKNLLWGIHFSAGTSCINDKIFSLAQTERVADFNNAPSAAFASPIRYNPRSKIKAGFAFQLGPVVEKKISNRSKLSVGLLYGYYSHRIKVGPRRDSILRLSNFYLTNQTFSGYYQGNPQNDFTNKYHFIELPLQYSLQLNKGKKIPINWAVGATLGRMISSNGLAYDTANRGIYLNNKKLLNKNNVGISSGFSFDIHSANKMRLSFGPNIRFSLTNFYKNDFDENKYLLYGGIKINLLFPHK